jgi:hypothetical protein
VGVEWPRGAGPTGRRETVVAGEGQLTEDQLRRAADGLATFGAGEFVLFDAAAGRGGDLAWLVRSEAEPATVGRIMGKVARTAGAPLASYRVDGRDAHGAPEPSAGPPGIAEPVPGVRKVTFHRRLPGTTPSQYAVRFAAHGPIAAIHHAHARRYRQSLVLEYEGPSRLAADGISEHWYGSIADAVDRHFARDDSRQVVAADVAGWLDVASALVGYGHAWRWN